MTHIDEAALYSLVFAGGALPQAEQAHLDGCETCRGQQARLLSLKAALALHQRSEPSSEAISGYRLLFDQIRPEDALARARRWVNALLTLDTRRTAAVGMRGGAPAAYRLLYSTDAAEVELAVAAEGGMRRVEGEVLMLHEDGPLLPALIQLVGDGLTVAESQTDAGGRFRLPPVPPGAYRLWIVLADASEILIEDLNIG